MIRSYLSKNGWDAVFISSQSSHAEKCEIRNRKIIFNKMNAVTIDMEFK